MEISEDTSKVEASLKDSRIRSLLKDLIELCSKHKVFIFTEKGETIIEFNDWDFFTVPSVDSEGASMYWPRIQTEIVVRRKNE